MYFINSKSCLWIHAHICSSHAICHVSCSYAYFIVCHRNHEDMNSCTIPMLLSCHLCAFNHVFTFLSCSTLFLIIMFSIVKGRFIMSICIIPVPKYMLTFYMPIQETHVLGHVFMIFYTCLSCMFTF